MRGDGNCLFRALSHQVYGTEDKHLQFRLFIQEFIEQNKDKYEPYWINPEVTNHAQQLVSYAHHLQEMKKPGVWGTLLELKAFSDLLSYPLFICSPEIKTRAYKWNKIVPTPSGQRLTLPLSFTADHIELAHSSSRDHYDSVVPYNSSTLLPCPVLTPGVVATINLIEP